MLFEGHSGESLLRVWRSCPDASYPTHRIVPRAGSFVVYGELSDTLVLYLGFP